MKTNFYNPDKRISHTFRGRKCVQVLLNPFIPMLWGKQS